MTDMTDETADSPRIGLRRRSVLTAAGLGAGLAALSGTALPETASAAPPPEAPEAAGVAAPATADLPLVGGADFPIGVFWPPPPTQITLARYQEIADAGFTFLL